MSRIGVVLLVVPALFGVVLGDITIGSVKCGQKTCKYGEYCSEIDRICEPCTRICDESSHNYEPGVCQRQCQDYLHDSRYVRKDGLGPQDNDLRNTVTYLSKMLTVTLTLVCIMLIILVSVFCFQVYRWKVKKNITWKFIKSKLFKKPGDISDSRTNGTQDIPPKKPVELKISMPSTIHSADNSPNTLSTSINSRRPAEDSTLDYVYENPAMKNANSSF